MSNIHQEIRLSAAPSRIYRSLVDSRAFAELSGAPASGDSSEGAAFSVFGGHISGRHVELVLDRRIVQAWRAKTWPAGLYSIARFELHPDGQGTKIVFDHDGFPEDMKA
ncbi:MAG TPA: SRPBCC domain-containing protein, partial [Polyangiales bacterium]